MDCLSVYGKPSHSFSCQLSDLPRRVVNEGRNLLSNFSLTKIASCFSSVVVFPVARGVVALTRSIGLILPYPEQEMTRRVIERVTTQVVTNCGAAEECSKIIIDVDRVLSSGCRLSEYLDQVNRHVSSGDGISRFQFRQFQHYPLSYERILLLAPLEEEFIFRHLIHETLLKNLPILLGVNRDLINSRFIRVTRIFISAALFSACHLTNGYDEALKQAQLVHTFVLGLALGGLCEVSEHFPSNFLLPLITHIGYNFLGAYAIPMLNECDI